MNIMKCAKLHLQERLKPKPKDCKLYSTEKPRRYCQKRMVNPDHDEDPRWMDAMERFKCTDVYERDDYSESFDNQQVNKGFDSDDLYLSVQNITFQGNLQQHKRQRTSFKYKIPEGNKKHRMFVKQTVDICEEDEQERSSQLTHYFDDYVKYIINDGSRPSSVKSYQDTIQQIEKISKENIPTPSENNQNKCNNYHTNKKSFKKINKLKTNVLEEIDNDDLSGCNLDDTTVAFHKSGKRQSLTISRTQSPETVQVIRVDVVRNYSSSSSVISEKQDEKDTKLVTKEFLNLRTSHFAQKYLLTNTVKKLDQNISGGKVTLICKTFRLSDRAKSDYKQALKNRDTKF